MSYQSDENPNAPVAFDVTHRNKKKNQNSVETLNQPLDDQIEKSNAMFDESDFECALCFRLLYQPATLICGHTFCKNCILMALKVKAECPMCREKILVKKSEFKLSVSYILSNLIEKHFNKEYKEREKEEKSITIKLKDIKSSDHEAMRGLYDTTNQNTSWHHCISQSLISFYPFNV